ncbi:N-formylglutamate amidohydrolase [Brevibacillus sp. SYP-B805]|uniref:N-formylglutamate amidohydrolase n=1 Tax=Brevibacillus sp. SYP-B805 TaxID=1578199 RepID=UPI0013EE0D8B|nr:N-formylglutamate amidohydrolase [Brevibacillus sp. SYP-B805]
MAPPYIQRTFLKYNKGNGFVCCHIDALHAMPPVADLFTDRIVTGLMEKTGCAGIIGTVSRKKADLNRSPDGENNAAIREYREALQEILEHVGVLDPERRFVTKPYLHLAMHGMKDLHHGPYAIEIGTRNGKSCSAEIRAWLREMLTVQSRSLLPDVKIFFDKKFKGHKSIRYHRSGDGHDYPGYGQHFHTFQVEISRTLREKYLSDIIELFSHIIVQFQLTFANSRDEK